MDEDNQWQCLYIETEQITDKNAETDSIKSTEITITRFDDF